MKALRYLLMVITVAIVSVTVQAQSTVQFKTSENKVAFDYQVGKTHFDFYSTSSMMGSGSNLPLAARNGLTIGANTPDDNATAGVITRGPRRAKADDDPFSGEGTAGDVDNPQEPGTPIGEGMWVMLLLAVWYAGWMMLRRRGVMADGESRSIPCAQS